jgi:hypothetical protein
MTVKRGEIWLADLNPTRGSEQAGTRSPGTHFSKRLGKQIYDDCVGYTLDDEFTPGNFTFVCAGCQRRRWVDQ